MSSTKEVSKFTTKDVLAVLGGLAVIVLFFLSTGLVLHYGVAPALEWLSNLIDLSAYQQGIVDLLWVEFIILVFLYLVFSAPRMGRRL